MWGILLTCHTNFILAFIKMLLLTTFIKFSLHLQFPNAISSTQFHFTLFYAFKPITLDIAKCCNSHKYAAEQYIKNYANNLSMKCKYFRCRMFYLYVLRAKIKLKAKNRNNNNCKQTFSKRLATNQNRRN